MQNSESPDLIYVIVPQADGTLTVSLTSDWDGGLYVRTDCGDSQTELVCTDVLGDNATEVLQVGVTASTSYYVYVDGLHVRILRHLLADQRARVGRGQSRARDVIRTGH